MCVFCRIVAGELPATVVAEGRKVIAILDINPVNKGHTLVISKEHYTDITEVPKEVLCEAVTVAKEIAKNMKEKLGADGVNLFQTNGKAAGQEVFHFHLHVIPRYRKDGVKFKFPVTKYRGDEEKKSICKKLRVVDGDCDKG